jgi:hypothetical protein
MSSIKGIKGAGKQVVQVVGIITRPIMKLASGIKTIVKIITQKV